VRSGSSRPRSSAAELGGSALVPEPATIRSGPTLHRRRAPQKVARARHGYGWKAGMSPAG
jgi:hypothetical protein